jgi:hypothetical protein
MLIRYNTRQSRFVGPVRQAIEAMGGQVRIGRPLTVILDEAGYEGDVVVEIVEDHATNFWTDWDSEDPSRFPARIRAAATALRDAGCFGRFLISYQSRLLQVARL